MSHTVCRAKKKKGGSEGGREGLGRERKGWGRGREKGREGLEGD